MTPLTAAEAKLRDLAGYRGHPSSEMALTGPECLLIVEELDALRALVKARGNLEAMMQRAFETAPPPEGVTP